VTDERSPGVSIFIGRSGRSGLIDSIKVPSALRRFRSPSPPWARIMYQSNLMYRANLTREFRSALYFRHCCSWQGVTRFAAENCRTYRQLGRTDHQRIINGQAWNRYV